MGAAASTSRIAGPTDVGKFQLSPPQKKYLDVVSNLFQLLLRKNNIMDLAELISSKEDACNDLIITLSDKLDKEFQHLQFTTSLGEPTKVSFLSEDLYRRIQKSDLRRSMCDKIAAFLLQFVVLVTALTASVAITDRDPSIEHRDIVYVPMSSGDELEGTVLIDPRVLSSLKDTRVLKEVTGSRGDVYSVNDSVFIHKTGLLYAYKTGSDKNAVFSISIDFLTAEYFSKQGLSPGLSQGLSQSQSPAAQSYGTQGPSSSRLFYNPEAERERIRAEEELKARLKTGEREIELKYERERAARSETRVLIANMQRKAASELLVTNQSLKEITMRIAMFKNIFTNPVISKKLRDEIDNQRRGYLNGNNKLFLIFKTYDALEKTIENELKPNVERVKDYVNKDVAVINFEDFKRRYESVAGFDFDNANATLNRVMNDLNNLVNENMDNDKYAGFKNVINSVKSSIRSNSNSVRGQINSGSVTSGASTIGGASEYLEVTVSTYRRGSASSQGDSFGEYSGRNRRSPYPSNASNASNASNTSKGYVYSGGAVGTIVSTFVIDLAGNVYDEQLFRRSAGRVTKDQRSSSLRERLDSIFKRYSNETEFFDIQNRFTSEKQAQSQEYKNFGSDLYTMKDAKKGVVEPLLKFFRTELDKSNAAIQSPAAQRAYLLSSGISNDRRIITKICDDPWNNASLSTIPAYSLFKAIHTNLMKGTVMQVTNPTFLTSLGNRVTDDPTDTLWTKKFKGASITASVSTFCETDGIKSKPAEIIVKTAYRKLQQLYSQHLQQVLVIMNQLFMVNSTFESVLSSPSGADTTEPILQLHPMFSTQNAETYLEQMTKNAIEILDKHYSAVENTYGKAIKDLETSIITSMVPTKGGSRKTRKYKQIRRTAALRKTYKH